MRSIRTFISMLQDEQPILNPKQAHYLGLSVYQIAQKENYGDPGQARERSMQDSLIEASDDQLLSLIPLCIRSYTPKGADEIFGNLIDKKLLGQTEDG